MSTRSELARVELLRARFASTAGAEAVTVGIGDDAAVLSVAGDGELVWTVDAQVDGTHFRTDWVSWADVGWRSFMAAASDLAAMGARPVAALSSLILAAEVDDGALEALAAGQAEAAAELRAPIVGGNLARGRETSITTTLVGRARTPVLRSGARPGDGLWLAGPLGLARAGLALVAKPGGVAALEEGAAACVQAWRRPIARLRDGQELPGRASACIDVSDGLARDAWQLAVASGVMLVLEEAALLAAGGAALSSGARALGLTPLELALVGGEDYALLAASPVPLSGFVRVGRVEEHTGGGRLFTATALGVVPLEPRGFDHFA
jgi:thiamine-monophosphate kinase